MNKDVYHVEKPNMEVCTLLSLRPEIRRGFPNRCPRIDRPALTLEKTLPSSGGCLLYVSGA